MFSIKDLFIGIALFCAGVVIGAAMGFESARLYYFGMGTVFWGYLLYSLKKQDFFGDKNDNSKIQGKTESTEGMLKPDDIQKPNKKAKQDESYTNFSEDDFVNRIFESYNKQEYKECKNLLEALEVQIPDNKYMKFAGDQKLTEINEILRKR